jgi:serine/threonine protein kinase
MEPVQESYVAIKEYFPKRFANRKGGNTVVPNNSIEDQRIFKWGLKRFLDEAKVLARLDHPNIIKVQRYFELHGTAYLVMEYCDGKSLDNFVGDGSLVSPRRVFQIYKSLIDALEHVHQQGVIHGDLKPSNILVRPDGTPVLLDFGSARQEMLRMVVGQVTDGYSPPEFYGTLDKIGPWSDIYGLAATFYRLITGIKVPVATDRAKSDSYTPVSTLITDGYSFKFLELIDNSLKLATSDRPQSTTSLKHLLPDSSNFSNGYIVDKDVRSESSKPTALTFNWKPVAIVLGIIACFWGGFALLNYSSENLSEVEKSVKVSPIPIPVDESVVIAESTSPSNKTVIPLPEVNPEFQQALSYLSKASTSLEISWYSLPQSEKAERSFIYVIRHIQNQISSAFDRKAVSENKTERGLASSRGRRAATRWHSTRTNAGNARDY